MQMHGVRYNFVKKRNILILGGSSDIGKYVISKLVKENHKITAQINKTNNALRKFNNKIKTIKFDFDISSYDNLKIFSNKFDVIVNCVGYIDNKTIFNSRIEDTLKSIKINSIIPFYIIKENINFMKKNGYGRILNCSSISVKYGGGHNTFNYSMSKHCNEFIPNDIKKLCSMNILYNSLRIGVTNTRIHKKISGKNMKKRILMIPSKNIAEISEIGDYINYLISEKNTFIVNQTLTIAGGE